MIHKCGMYQNLDISVIDLMHFLQIKERSLTRKGLIMSFYPSKVYEYSKDPEWGQGQQETLGAVLLHNIILMTLFTAATAIPLETA